VSFPVEALHVDGGSELQTAFEQACQKGRVAPLTHTAFIEEGTVALLQRKSKRFLS
jgi:hypothetical protein